MNVNTATRKKKRRSYTLTAAVCVILLAVSFTLFWVGVRNYTGASSDEYMNNAALQKAQTLAERFSGELRELDAVADIIESNLYTDPRLCAELLGCLPQEKYCVRLGVITSGGEAYDTNGDIYQFSDFALLESSLCRITDSVTGIITEGYEDTDGRTVHLFAVQTKFGTADSGYLYSIIEASALSSLLGTNTDSGYFCVIDKNGGYIVDSSGGDGYDVAQKDRYNRMVARFESGETVGDSGSERYALTHLGFNDWYLIYSLPVAQVNANANIILIMTFVLGAVLLTVCVYAFWSYYRHSVKEKLETLAEQQRDALTGISNYSGIRAPIAETIVSSPPGTYAIVDMDIDNFSGYNALYGFAEGDEIIRFIAKTLVSECGTDELVCRSDADRFIMLFRYRSSAETVARIRRLDEVISSKPSGFVLSLSFGIYEITDPFLPIDTLRDRAAVARRTVKGMAEKKLAFYDASLHEKRLLEARLVSGMDEAMKNNEFIPYYQPVINLSSGKCIAAEAYARRIIPGGEVLSPASFLEAFERNGQIARLDRYIFERVCNTLTNIDAPHAVPISVNVSRTHLFDSYFPDRIMETMAKYGIKSSMIEVELSESVFFGHEEDLSRLALKLRQLGARVAIDNFGSSASSLNLLKYIPVSVIKLDRQLTSDALKSEKNKKILLALISLAKSIGVECYAEGVESAEQERLLRECGCDAAQGYYYASPMTEAEFTAYLNSGSEPE